VKLFTKYAIGILFAVIFSIIFSKFFGIEPIPALFMTVGAALIIVSTDEAFKRMKNNDEEK
jgi:hypothetical protein